MAIGLTGEEGRGEWGAQCRWPLMGSSDEANEKGYGQSQHQERGGL